MVDGVKACAMNFVCNKWFTRETTIMVAGDHFGRYFKFRFFSRQRGIKLLIYI
jgi:hypothetical protein